MGKKYKNHIIGLVVVGLLVVLVVWYVSKPPAGTESYEKSIFKQPLDACCNFDMDCESDFCDWTAIKFFSTDCLLNSMVSKIPVGKCKAKKFPAQPWPAGRNSPPPL